jgi:hypothetical protein
MEFAFYSILKNLCRGLILHKNYFRIFSLVRLVSTQHSSFHVAKRTFNVSWKLIWILLLVQIPRPFLYSWKKNKRRIPRFLLSLDLAPPPPLRQQTAALATFLTSLFVFILNMSDMYIVRYGLCPLSKGLGERVYSRAYYTTLAS